MKVCNKFTLVSICSIVIIPIVVYHQAYEISVRVPASSTSVIVNSPPVIRTAAESLYSMYGEGNYTDIDEQVLSYIRSMMSKQGPGGHRLADASRIHYSQLGGSQFVDKLLQRRRNGFFVECGAFRGENLSDTLFFELHRNWTGILIEAHPEYHREILRKNRRALVLRACLSSTRRPGSVLFKLLGWGSGVSAFNKNVGIADKTAPETHVQCFSLNSIMAAIGVHHIDFMVLDVEGSELPVLESIDWTRLSVDVFSIEYSEHIGNRVKKLKKIRKFFNETGKKVGFRYKQVGVLPLTRKENSAQDAIFMRV